MLISRGLYALFWSTVALAATLQDSSSAPHRSFNTRSRTGHVLQQADASRSIQRRNGTPTQVRLHGRWNGRLYSRQEEQCEREECSSDISAEAEDGEAKDDAGGASTVTLMTTVLRTVTAGSGTSTTTVTSTSLQTLTFVDSALPTQTNTLTVTAAPPTQRRARQLSVPETAVESDVSESVQAQSTSGGGRDAAGENGAQATQAINVDAAEGDDAVTVMETVERVTTVAGVTTITSTVINTEFVTVTLAPGATATEIVTTTVQFTPGIPDDQPSSATPSQDVDLPSETFDTEPSPTQTRSRRPPGTTDAAPSSTPTDPNNPQSMQPSAEPSQTNDPSRPIAGTNLSADEIAGVAVGIIFGLLFLILAGFLIYRLVRKRQAAELLCSHQEMSSSASGSASASPPAAGSLGSSSTRNRLLRPATAASPSSAATSPGEGDVRIVIRPAPKRRTQSSGLLPSDDASRTESTPSERVGTRSQWPRPPGYSGQTYSFFIEESRSVSPLDARQWSVASEQGSRGEGSDSVGRARGSGAGGGGSEYLSIARAFSPWKAV